MVFQLNKQKRRLSNAFSISEWDDAPNEEVEEEEVTTGGSWSGGSHHGADSGSAVVAAEHHHQDETLQQHAPSSPPEEEQVAAAPPEMNLGSVYTTLQYIRRASDDTVDCEVQVANSDHGRHHRRRRASTDSNNKPSMTKLMSFGHHRRASANNNADDSCDLTVAPSSSSASRTSYSSSVGTNIWTKLLGGQGHEGVWDAQLNSKHKGGDAFDEADNSFDDDDNDDDDSMEDSCRKSMKRCGLAWWYETRHFVATVAKHPHIWIVSLLAFGVICTVGMVAINGEREKSVQKQKSMATFVATETAQWFSNEFRRAMLPLYSVQQGVIHSGYFNDLADQIGQYPNRLIPSSEETPFTKRNVTGICDSPSIINKWRSIVQPINAENDLDGIIVGYRLFPNNVACLTEPHGQESNEQFKAEDFPQGEALLASDNVMGLDTGHTGFPLWKMITTDLFVNKQFNIFGPFAMPPMSELICGHLAIWTKPGEEDIHSQSSHVFDNTQDDNTAHLLENSSLDVHGTKVEGAWGFVVNFLDWTKLKEKSNIYNRFSDCNLEFQLSRVGGATVETVDRGLLAESPKSHLLDDTNSIVVETNSLHGVWQNRVGSLDGWSPPWYPAAVAGVILTSLILGLLTASTLVERQLHRNLLYKVMPRRAIAKLHRGQTVLEKFNLVTIFFSDIVGFTSMAGTMRPIQVMKMLNELYTELDKLVEKHQVYKVETIGDAYMVVGGAPDRIPAPLAAERVALFSLDAIDFVKNFRTKDGDQIFIRAGLASGPTVAGVVGQAMPRYCFFGDTVNFASRMESTSKKMRIQCAEITYRLLRDAPRMNFALKKRMEGDIAGVQIKGKGHQITYWIEKSSPRDTSHKVIDVGPRRVEPEPLSKVDEVEDVTQDAAEVIAAEEGSSNGVVLSNKSNASDDGYEEFLQIIKPDSKPGQ